MSHSAHLSLKSPTDFKDLNLREIEKLIFKVLTVLSDGNGFIGKENYICPEGI